MQSQADKVAAVVLAAGTSSRLGKPKQFLDINGRPLIRRVIDLATASSADVVIVVAGEHTTRVQDLVADTRATVVSNPDYASGQASSVLAGLRAMSEGTGAVLFVLGDQPQVSTVTIDQVIDLWRNTRAPIVQARYRGRPSHPVLFDRSLFQELETIAGDAGAAPIIRSHRHEIVPVEIDEDVPLDIDTEEDYQAVLARL